MSPKLHDSTRDRGHITSTTIDRRRFLERAAVIGWSAPVIITLMAESAAASHPDGCIHLEAECGVWDTTVSPKRCVDVPAGSGSTGDCCGSPTVTCKPTVRIAGQPCTCQD